MEEAKEVKLSFEVCLWYLACYEIFSEDGHRRMDLDEIMIQEQVILQNYGSLP